MNNDKKLTPDKISLDEIFDYVDIRSVYLNQMLKEVVAMISRSIDLFQGGFGPIHEGATFSGEPGEVTEDGEIYLDTELLKKYDDDVAMAIIAHELAHHYLDHHLDFTSDGLEKEYEADELARKWGFNVEKFRDTCGPPTIHFPIR